MSAEFNARQAAVFTGPVNPYMAAFGPAGGVFPKTATGPFVPPAPLSRTEDPVARLFDTELNDMERLELGAFLSGPVGSKVLRKLYTDAPRIPAQADNSVFVKAGMAQGWTECIERLMSLSSYSPAAAHSPGVSFAAAASQPSNSGYPDLDDESAWNGVVPR